jgi:hypothetical protein
VTVVEPSALSVMDQDVTVFTLATPATITNVWWL